jgi:hypothetical protein
MKESCGRHLPRQFDCYASILGTRAWTAVVTIIEPEVRVVNKQLNTPQKDDGAGPSC